MIDFQIGIEESRNGNCSEPDRLRIRLGDACLTRLVRRGSNAPDDWLMSPRLLQSSNRRVCDQVDRKANDFNGEAISLPEGWLSGRKHWS